MTDVGWYQRKLAAARGRAQPQTQVSPFRAPGVPDPSQRPAPVPGYPQQQPQQQQFVPQYEQPEQVTVENIYEQAGRWRGGPGAKANPNPCPQCGSNQYFSRASTSRRLPPPAPHCYNCGYNDGMFEQGLASSWQGPG